MGWTKRQSVSDLVVLGDAEGQVRKVAGLLASLRQDTRFPANMNYEVVQQNGESVNVAGSASLSRQIGPADIGHFIKCQFKGWGDSPNGKFKDIEVLVFEGEVTEEMKKWPRWKELNAQFAPPFKKTAPLKATNPADDEDFPLPDASDEPDEADDDLPF